MKKIVVIVIFSLINIVCSAQNLGNLKKEDIVRNSFRIQLTDTLLRACRSERVRTDYYNLSSYTGNIIIKDGSKSEGTVFVLGKIYRKSGHSNEFIFEDTGDGYYRIKNCYTKLYMTIKNGKQIAGTEIVQEPYRKGNSQKFKINYIRTHSYQGIAYDDIYSFTSTNGLRIGMWKATRNWGTYMKLVDNKTGYTPGWVLRNMGINKENQQREKDKIKSTSIFK